MTGIIINDSIVLITVIDEYAEERGLIPSIIDGTADRLRPVLLTTLTTVLGLTPLLYETSQQAQFLKPTIITLVYGLGFGMLLVLLVLPALVAVQHDVGRQITAMRRATASPLRGLRAGFVGLWALVLAWGAATLGWVIWTGEMVAPLAGAFAGLEGLAPMVAALALFVAGVGVLCLLGYMIFALVLRRQARATL
jgi:predicted RND superfamily exporter protein